LFRAICQTVPRCVMRTRDKEGKSSHLRDLEEVFDRRARRFSPFSVLGLSQDGNSDSDNIKSEEEKSSQATQGLSQPPPGLGQPSPPRGGSSTPTVEEIILSSPPLTYQARFRLHANQETAESKGSAHNLSLTLPTPEIVAAIQIGAQLGQKAKAVLGYLNSIRSLESEAYTVPVGYSQISSAAQIDGDYLRRKVLPKLAMLGLIGIARKGLSGTIYYLPYPGEYLKAVSSVGDNGQLLSGNIPARTPVEISEDTVASSISSVNHYEWLDKEFWGWLSEESIQRLVNRAGSEAKAKEKLDIILYNENHGAPEKRVRNRRSVLAHYLSSTGADIWPNDGGFETLEVKQLRQDRDRAKEEKALAEEALRERQGAAKAQFLSLLNDAQMRWLKQEAKRRVDVRPEAKIVTSRYPLYKAEEESLTCEWTDRVEYGESVPEAEVVRSSNQEAS